MKINRINWPTIFSCLLLQMDKSQIIKSSFVQYLLCKIKQKLNPYFSARTHSPKKIILRERCTKEEFSTIFPEARAIESKKRVRDIRFSTTRKIQEIKFTKTKHLDGLFGANWDLVFNKTSVGFCCPTIAFRLLETTIFSSKTPLCDSEIDLEECEPVETMIFHSISISFERSSVSRWSSKKDESSGRFVEAKYLKKVRKIQKKSRELNKKRMFNYKKRK